MFELCDVLAALLDYGITEGDIDSLEYRLHRVLSLLERDFPVSLHVIVFHLLHHMHANVHSQIWARLFLLDVSHGKVQQLDCCQDYQQKTS